MEGNNKGNQVLLIVIGIATLLMAVVGATFAYFSATATTGENHVDQTVNISTATISVSFEEGNGVNLENTTLTSDLKSYIPFKVSNPDNEDETAVQADWKLQWADVTENTIVRYANLTAEGQPSCATLAEGCIDVSDDFTYTLYKLNITANEYATLVGDELASGYDSAIADHGTSIATGYLAGVATGTDITTAQAIAVDVINYYVLVIEFNYLADDEVTSRSTNLQNYQQGKSFNGEIQVIGLEYGAAN